MSFNINGNNNGSDASRSIVSREKLIKILKRQLRLFKRSNSFYANGFKDCVKDIIQELGIDELESDGIKAGVKSKENK